MSEQTNIKTGGRLKRTLDSLVLKYDGLERKLCIRIQKIGLLQSFKDSTCKRMGTQLRRLDREIDDVKHEIQNANHEFREN